MWGSYQEVSKEQSYCFDLTFRQLRFRKRFMNRAIDGQEALSAFQRQVLKAVADGAALYARPDGSLAYVSIQNMTAYKQTAYRCLRVIPPKDFFVLVGLYIQPAQGIPGTGIKLYSLTGAGWRAAK
jgi:hypothetical protein